MRKRKTSKAAKAAESHAVVMILIC